MIKSPKEIGFITPRLRFNWWTWSKNLEKFLRIITNLLYSKKIVVFSSFACFCCLWRLNTTIAAISPWISPRRIPRESSHLPFKIKIFERICKQLIIRHRIGWHDFASGTNLNALSYLLSLGLGGLLFFKARGKVTNTFTEVWQCFNR